jgi:citronellol/citronellal dehydrogenase
MFSHSFDDSVVLVTGASRGIGRAVAVEFARCGAHVAVTSRTTANFPSRLPGTLEETADAVRALGRTALVAPADITQEDQVRDMVRRTLEHFGGVDILVNNAGISAPAPFVETSLKRFDLIMNVNLRGPAILLQELLPSMIERRTGCLINVNSYLPMTQEWDNQSIYSAAKMAFENITSWLARELAPYDIPANTLAIDREIASEGWKVHRPDIDYSTWEQPEAVAEVALWMAAQPKTYTGRVVTMAAARDDMAAAGVG